MHKLWDFGWNKNLSTCKGKIKSIVFPFSLYLYFHPQGVFESYMFLDRILLRNPTCNNNTSSSWPGYYSRIIPVIILLEVSGQDTTPEPYLYNITRGSRPVYYFRILPVCNNITRVSWPVYYFKILPVITLLEVPGQDTTSKSYL